MPNMANITVKKADGTTDILWTALQPSSGDGVSAVWRSETAGVQANVKPTFALASRWNGPRTARRLDYSILYPQKYTDSASGLDLVANRAILSGNFTLPTGIPDLIAAEAVAQSVNLLASALVKSCLQAGYAPT